MTEDIRYFVEKQPQNGEYGVIRSESHEPKDHGFRVKEHAEFTAVLFNEESNSGDKFLGPTHDWSERIRLWNEFLRILNERGKPM